MSERGVFAVDRGIWDHPVLQSKDPFSRREAWLWLLSEATWKERSLYREGRRIVVNRGQLAHSIRFIAEAWGWPKSNVARFLEALKTDTMIGTEIGTGLTIITICNYDEYQKVSLPKRDSSGTENGTQTGQQRDKLECKEDLTYLSSSVDSSSSSESQEAVSTPARSNERAREPDDWPDDFADIFWRSYPLKRDKAAVFKKLALIRKTKLVTWVKMIGAVRAYIATADSQFLKYPLTWLNKGCWDDELAEKPRDTNGKPWSGGQYGNREGPETFATFALRNARAAAGNNEPSD